MPATDCAHAARPQGTAGCQAGPLLAFLRDVSCERLYLVGDFVDGWELSERRVHWPQARARRAARRGPPGAAERVVLGPFRVWNFAAKGRTLTPRRAQEHSDVIQKLLRLARKGTKGARRGGGAGVHRAGTRLTSCAARFKSCAVIYTPGNHDEALRDFIQDTSIQLGENMCVDGAGSARIVARCC